jgi:hypothetical protein
LEGLTMDFLDAAFHLTQFGFRVFPLATLQKAPAIPARFGGRGCLDATDDENVIADWARKYPRANIGIACGEISRCVVIDLDPRNGSDATIAELAAKGRTFPPTVTARTANGGTHLYYAYEASLKNSKSVLGEGIDVKTNRGYVVAPPSLLDSQRKYTWVRAPLGDSFPPLPQWAVNALRPKPEPVVSSAPSGPVSKDIDALIRYVKNSNSGMRNNALFWAACVAAQEGLLDNSAKAAFESAAVGAGLERKDVLKTIASADKKKKLGC